LLSDESACDAACPANHPARREFLFAAGGSVIAVLLPGLLPVAAQARVAEYPKKKVGRLSKLRKGEPVAFRYPWDHDLCESVLLRLGQAAAGGVGPDRDVVAFNRLCTHMGRAIPARKFDAATGVAGPCAWHWTTFDLTRHGMVVSGHATEGLPQVLLELDGDEVVARGVLGLLYGLHNNRVDPKG
jgi:arsenite oxidase small subunit